MLLVAGLGNPGAAYDGTRHNVGFLVVEELAHRRRATFRRGNGPWYEATVDLAGIGAVLVKPTTFMNLSGEAVVEAGHALGIAPADMLVVFDDFQLPLGLLRLRLQGTDGGHNGMASVIASLGTTEVPRLRCGIASHHLPSDKDRLADYVLKSFADDEREAVRTMVLRAADAVEMVMRSGWQAAMNEFNRPLPGTDADAESV